MSGKGSKYIQNTNIRRYVQSVVYSHIIALRSFLSNSKIIYPVIFFDKSSFELLYITAKICNFVRFSNRTSTRLVTI